MMKTACNNSKIISSVVNTPIGLYTIQACRTGVHSILLADTPSDCDENSKPSPNLTSESATTAEEKVLESCKIWLESYFQKDKKSHRLVEAPEVCFEGIDATDFERHVWKTLQTTRMGETLSYGDLANLVRNPKAARAVGAAMKKNPVTILIPCHRVVRSDFQKSGDHGDYSGGGPQNKEWLINHEKRV